VAPARAGSGKAVDVIAAEVAAAAEVLK
jgi:hypothetical protein